MVIGQGVTSTELARQLVLEGNAMTEPETLLEGCRVGKPFHTMRPKDYLATHATVPTSVAVKRVTSGSVEYEDADGARHTVGVGHVTVCAGRRKVGLDLCGELVDAGLGTYRINNNERASDFLNPTRSVSEQAYTLWGHGPFVAFLRKPLGSAWPRRRTSPLSGRSVRGWGVSVGSRTTCGRSQAPNARTTKTYRSPAAISPSAHKSALGLKVCPCSECRHLWDRRGLRRGLSTQGTYKEWLSHHLSDPYLTEWRANSWRMDPQGRDATTKKMVSAILSRVRPAT